MSGDRFPCACRAPECGPCSATTAVNGQPCSSCAAGAHRPSAAIQDHLRASNAEWLRVMPVSLGSSGPSVTQIRHAVDAWTTWHRRQRCPAAWAP